jgi:hypothetical protein
MMVKWIEQMTYSLTKCPGISRIFYAAWALCFCAVALIAMSAQTLAQSEDETRGLYFKEIACAAVMAKISVVAEAIPDAPLAKAFEDRTQKHVEDAIALGAKLNMTQDSVIADWEKQGKQEVELGVFTPETIMTSTISCAPELVPLLK